MTDPRFIRMRKLLDLSEELFGKDLSDISSLHIAGKSTYLPLVRVYEDTVMATHDITITLERPFVVWCDFDEPLNPVAIIADHGTLAVAMWDATNDAWRIFPLEALESDFFKNLFVYLCTFTQLPVKLKFEETGCGITKDLDYAERIAYQRMLPCVEIHKQQNI